MKKIQLWELNLTALKDGPVLVATPDGQLVRVARRSWVGRSKGHQKLRYETGIGDFNTIVTLTRALANL